MNRANENEICASCDQSLRAPQGRCGLCGRRVHSSGRDNCAYIWRELENGVCDAPLGPPLPALAGSWVAQDVAPCLTGSFDVREVYYCTDCAAPHW